MENIREKIYWKMRVFPLSSRLSWKLSQTTFHHSIPSHKISRWLKDLAQILSHASVWKWEFSNTFSTRNTFCTIIKYQLRHFGHVEKSLWQEEELGEKLFHYLIFFLCCLKARSAAKILSDRKSVIREPRDDVIRISSLSWI